ncbi:hypothetical protein B0H17DRAFT_1145970 [Mycena rosella]|uniref:Retroviral polymerase SH3-like domain-containing protein n=1 Tax=Mycena rosella TaxID=1033263 RepID=A0AAD7CQP4_MYCRO|nr:hypothetical protein B0H17DRAFT_1145970 [Mycena rosella]
MDANSTKFVSWTALMTMAGTMLLRQLLVVTGTSQSTWRAGIAEAVTAHCYVHGFIPLACHLDIIPWSTWFHKVNKDEELVKLNVSHLRAWGSICWVKDLDYVEEKLGKQGWKGFLVGYMGRHGYRVFDPKRSEVFRVRNVIAKEGKLHRTCITVDNNSAPEPPFFDTDDVPVINPAPAVIPAPVCWAPAAQAPASIAQAPRPPCPPPRRTARVPKPTQAILKSEMLDQREEQARLAGEEWADSGLHPP